MEEHYPYTGYENYTGYPASVPDSAPPENSSGTRIEDSVPPPRIAVSTDSRRLYELDLSGDSGSVSSATAGGYREEPVAYLHDFHRVSPHPLGLTTMPEGVTAPFWKRFESGGPVTVKMEPETEMIHTAPLEKRTDVQPQRLKTRLSQTAKNRPASNGGGKTPGPPGGPETEHHDSTEMPFLDHLEELRWTILKSIIVIVITMIGAWYLSDWFYAQVTELAKGGKSFLNNSTSVNIPLAPRTGHEGLLSGVITDAKTGKPIPSATVIVNPGNYTAITDSAGKYALQDVPEGNYTVTAKKNGYTVASKSSGMKLVMTTVMEPLLIRLQMALVMGIVLALPLVLYFVWSFVSPGLYQNEKQWVMPLIFASTGCFFIGAALAWFVIVPYMLKFLQAFMPPDIEGMFTFGKFLGIILKFTLSFGVIFELPMVSFVLAKIGIIRHTMMTKYRGYALVLVFVISAIITPTVDPVTQTLMAIPLYLLYEVSIIVAWFAEKKTIL